MLTNLMQGKRGLIMGVANDFSLGFGIAKALRTAGADLAFSYQSDLIYKRLKPIAEDLGSSIVLECDVTKEGAVNAMFTQLAKEWDGLDFVVHSLAFANKDELKGRYCDTSRAGFALALDVSCFSFVEICKEASPYMNNGGSFLTLTYYGAEKVIPNYNVMGVAKAALDCSVRYLANDLGEKNIRVNGLSAGPVKTLAAMGISDFRDVLNWHKHNTPLKRNVTLDDVSKAGLYLLSDLSSGVTGEIHHVDCGYNIIGMKALEKESL